MQVLQRCLCIFWSSVLKQEICYMDVADEWKKEKENWEKSWMKSGVEKDE